MYFFPRIFNILRPRLRPHLATIGCTVNGQPIRVTVHSDLRSDELLSYMQGMGCSELGKNTIFNEHPVLQMSSHRGSLLVIEMPEVGIYKRKQEGKITRKHIFDQVINQKKKKNGWKHALDQESKIQEKTITIKKKEGRKWKRQIRINHLATFFRYVLFGRIDRWQKLL